MEYNRLIQIGNEIESTEKPIPGIYNKEFNVLQIEHACNAKK